MRLTGYHSCLVAVLLVISAGLSEAFERCCLKGDPHLQSWDDGNKGSAPYPCNYLATNTTKFPVDDQNTTFQVLVTTSSSLETVRGRYYIDSVQVVICKFCNDGTLQKRNLKVDRDDMEANLETGGNPWTDALSLGSPFNSYVITSFDNITGTATLLVTDSDGNPKVIINFYPRLSSKGFKRHRGLCINVSDDAVPDSTYALFPKTACSILNDTSWGTGETGFTTTDQIIVHGLMSQVTVPQSRDECLLSFQAFNIFCAGNSDREDYFATCSPFFRKSSLVKCVDTAAMKNGTSYKAFGLCLKKKCVGLIPPQSTEYAVVLAYLCTGTP